MALTTSTVEQWTTEIRRDDDAWSQLEAEWEDLYARCTTTPPFACHAWLSSWWRCYGRAGALVLVLVRRDGRLVAATALARRRRLGLPVLAPVGEGVSDLSDVLVDPDHAAPALARLTEALWQLAHRHAIDLGELPPQAVAEGVVEAWPGRVWRSPGALCLELPGQSFADLLASLPSKTARRARNKTRTIDAAGIAVRWVDADGAAASVASLLALHREQWRGRPMNPEHARPRFATHLVGAATAMVGRGQAAIAEYRLDGALVGVDVLVVGHRLVGGYLYGIHPTLRRRVDGAQLLLTHNLGLTDRLGRPTFTYLRGDEPHKRVWRPTERRSQRIILTGRRSLTARSYVVAVDIRARVAAFVRTRLPGLRPAIARIRTWRRFSM